MNSSIIILKIKNKIYYKIYTGLGAQKNWKNR